MRTDSGGSRIRCRKKRPFQSATSGLSAPAGQICRRMRSVLRFQPRRVRVSPRQLPLRLVSPNGHGKSVQAVSERLRNPSRPGQILKTHGRTHQRLRADFSQISVCKRLGGCEGLSAPVEMHPSSAGDSRLSPRTRISRVDTAPSVNASRPGRSGMRRSD